MEYVTSAEALIYTNTTEDSLAPAKIAIIVNAVNAWLEVNTGSHAQDAYLKLIACKCVDYEFSNMNGLDTYVGGETFKFSTGFEERMLQLISNYIPDNLKPVGIVIRSIP